MTHNAAPQAAPQRRFSWASDTFGLDVRSLAIFRIALGSIVVADALLRTRDLRLMFAPGGTFPLEILRRWQGDPCSWSLATILDAEWVGPLVLTLEALSGMLLAAGFFTRAATVAAWIMVVSVIRRTAPATNAGDAWLCCLLFWGIFLPLGAVWSWDDGRRGSRTGPSPGPVRGPGAVALVLQVAAVYLSAGLGKLNDGWLSGAAAAHALSVHDHGTILGHRLFAGGWGSRPLSWGVVAAELLAPVLLVGVPRLRTPLAFSFIMFHAAACLLMSIGLFGYVGLAAWLPLLPAAVWKRGRARSTSEHRVFSGPEKVSEDFFNGQPARRAADAACVVAGMVAVASLVHDIGPAGVRPAPAPLVHMANLLCLHQHWQMFGTVERQEQWAYARGDLADGRIVDLLRGGRPLQTERPDGGFSTLPHHRWHKLLWNLQRPQHRVFAPPLAAALAADWNDRHAPGEHVISVELHFARLGRGPADDTLHDILLAAWPERNTVGKGALDRLLVPDAATARDQPPPPAAPRHGARDTPRAASTQ